MALDCRNHRLGHLQPRRPHRPCSIFVNPGAAPVSYFAQIGSGTKSSASTGKHRHAERIVGPLKVLKCIPQSVCCRGINGIADLRTIDGNRTRTLSSRAVRTEPDFSGIGFSRNICVDPPVAGKSFWVKRWKYVIAATLPSPPAPSLPPRQFSPVLCSLFSARSPQ